MRENQIWLAGSPAQLYSSAKRGCGSRGSRGIEPLSLVDHLLSQRTNPGG